MRAERAPAQRWLNTLDEHEIPGRPRRAGGQHLNRRPYDLALLLVVEAHAWTVGLVVVELLGVDSREAARVQRRGEEGDCARGRVAGVVPALKRRRRRGL